MLLDLKILNGDMPLKFDKYVNNYTVEIAEDVTKLEIDYKCNEGDLVNILNNDNLDYGLNYVFIEVTSNNTIKGLTYVIPREEFIKFNKPISKDTEITVKFYKKFEEASDSFRYFNRQYYNKPIINYIGKFFSDYLNDTPQDKITEATLITYINNYKKE